MESHKEVQHYDPIEKKLLHSQIHKAQKFIDNNCLEKLGDRVYICKPLPGYNKTKYTIEKKDEIWICNCQGFKAHCNCSHVQAILIKEGGLHQ